MAMTQTVADNDKAQAILRYLRTHAQTHTLPPTRQEIQHATGIASTGTVQRWLARLHQEGFIRLEPAKARAIFLTTKRLDD